MDSEFMPFDVFSYGRAAFIETEKVLAWYCLELTSLATDDFWVLGFWLTSVSYIA